MGDKLLKKPMEYGELPDKVQQELWEAYIYAIRFRLGLETWKGRDACPLCAANHNIPSKHRRRKYIGCMCPAGEKVGDGFCDRFLDNYPDNCDIMLRRKLTQLEGK